MIIILNGIVPLILTFLAVALVIYLSYLFSRYLSLGATKLNKTKYIKVLDRVPVGQDKLVTIVQIHDRYFLLGVSAQNINLLQELAAQDIVEFDNNQAGGNIAVNSFKDILKKVSKGDK